MFKIRKESDISVAHEKCNVCLNSLFSSNVSYYCLSCSDNVYFCHNCKESYLKKHNASHTIGTYYKSNEDFIKIFRMEIIDTTKKFIREKEFNKCILFCQKCMKMKNLTINVVLMLLKIGMICHVKLFEYSEAKKCAKNSLKLIGKLKERAGSEDEFIFDELDIICQLCHIYSKLEKFDKCLKFGKMILDNEEKYSMLDKEAEKLLDEIKYYTGKAYVSLEIYTHAFDLLNYCVLKKCLEKDYIKARLAFIDLINSFINQTQREEGISYYENIKLKYPDILVKKNDVDISFIKLKKAINKLKSINNRLSDISTGIPIDINNDMIAFNKLHYNVITNNDYEVSFKVLPKVIDASEKLIEKYSEDGIHYLEEIIKKRNSLIQRMYCCSLLVKKPKEALKWAERSKSFLFLNEINEVDRNHKEIDFDEIIKYAKKKGIVFLFFVVIQDLHFNTGDFIDVWTIGDLRKESHKTFYRQRLTHKPLEILKTILELYTEINLINTAFNGEIEKQGFQNTIQDIRKWQLFVDRLYNVQLKNNVYKRYSEVLEELYTYLIIPIQQYLPINENDDKLKKSKIDKFYNETYSIIIISDEFLSTVPFSFLKKGEGKYFIDDYCVSLSHSLKIFNYHLDQLKAGRKKRENDVKLSTSENRGLFGLVLTDEYSEFRKNELSPIYQLFNGSSNRSRNIESILLTTTTKESLQNILKQHKSSPKIIHFSNQSSIVGKNLPTFQRELLPNNGIKLCENEQLSTIEMREVFDLNGTELVLFGRASSISSNDTLDGMNEIHRSIISSGCCTILFPLYSVSDFFSTLFFIQFYKHLLGTDLQVKKSKGEAYRKAVQTSMEIFPYLRKSPFFLASYQIIGESLSKFEDSDN